MGFRERHGIVDLGVGVGARVPHYETIFGETPAMDWFEIISENFLGDGGRALEQLDKLRHAYRVIPHGVSLALGSVEPPSADYLGRLRALVDRIAPPWFSDHLCWGRVDGMDLHDLLPMPMTEAAVAHVADRIKQVQDTIGRPFALENVSSYLTYRESTMPEWAFLTEVAERADCGLLFDVNNVYVSAKNHGFDAATYVDYVPAHRVVQMHLAGHTDMGKYILDTHSDHVCDPVWDLYRRAVGRFGSVSTLVEWDENIPTWSVLSEEAARARSLRREVLAASPATVKVQP
jgi:uncharacterized protein